MSVSVGKCGIKMLQRQKDTAGLELGTWDMSTWNKKWEQFTAEVMTLFHPGPYDLHETTLLTIFGSPKQTISLFYHSMDVPYVYDGIYVLIN